MEQEKKKYDGQVIDDEFFEICEVAKALNLLADLSMSGIGIDEPIACLEVIHVAMKNQLSNLNRAMEGIASNFNNLDYEPIRIE